MYEVNVLRNLNECSSFRPQWIELVESMAYPSPFTHPDWILSALEMNKQEWSPYFIQVKSKANLVALLPLYIEKKHSVRKLRYVGDFYHPDPLGICCATENQKECIDVIKKHFSQSRQWDIVYLNWLMPHEADQWQKTETDYILSDSIAPYLRMTSSFEGYLKKFKRKKRYNLNASVRKFQKAGGCYCAANDYNNKCDFLNHLFSIHKKRSEERNIVSSFSGKKILQFHKIILKNMDSAWFRSLEIDRKTIAVLYGFLYQNRFFYYQIAHDPRYKKHSPGTVLLYKVIEECYNCGIEEFNFLQGDERYKWAWTKNSRKLYSFTIYNRTHAGIFFKKKDKAFSLAKNIFYRLQKKR